MSGYNLARHMSKISLDTRLPLVGLMAVAAWSGQLTIKIDHLESQRDENRVLVKELSSSIREIEVLLLRHVAGHSRPDGPHETQ